VRKRAEHKYKLFPWKNSCIYDFFLILSLNWLMIGVIGDNEQIFPIIFAVLNLIFKINVSVFKLKIG
jgi:hypothetical protein